MENKNVILNYTTEKYNKKYRNRVNKLLKYSKKQVEDFDNKYCYYEYNNKKYSLKYNRYYLLKDRKWALIEDTYYEIPKPVRLTWFRNLTVGAQAAICLLGTAAVSSAVVFPTLAATVWKKPNQPKEWYEDESYINSLKTSDVGIEKDIVVNRQVHKVRLIDVDKDKYDDKGTEKIAHTTWEFANLISDSDGYSLAYLWNDTNDVNSANYDYTNSSIRYALTGSGNNNGHGSTILAGVKGNTNWVSEYKDKTILSMLPLTLTSKLKTVKKSVGTTSGYTETEYSDKLFMPSTIELGYSDPNDKGFGSTYSYYKNATSSTDASRIKKQVNGSIVCTDSVSISSGSGHAYSGTAFNYAGYNDNADSTGGGMYWFRSPYSSYSRAAWRCNFDGFVLSYLAYVHVYGYAYGVAPAFCL